MVRHASASERARCWRVSSQQLREVALHRLHQLGRVRGDGGVLGSEGLDLHRDAHQLVRPEATGLQCGREYLLHGRQQLYHPHHARLLRPRIFALLGDAEQLLLVGRLLEGREDLVQQHARGLLGEFRPRLRGRWRGRLLLGSARPLPHRLVLRGLALLVEPRVERVARGVGLLQLGVAGLPLGRPGLAPRVDRRLVLLEPERELLGSPRGEGHLLGLGLALDLDDLHDEDQRRRGRDLGRLAVGAVGEAVRNVHLPLVALHHELHRLGPALDDLVGRERARRAALVRAVELRVIEQAARVVALARRPDRRVLEAAALLEHAVLQPRRERDHPILGLVGLKEDLASLLAVRVHIFSCRRSRVAVALGGGGGCSSIHTHVDRAAWLQGGEHPEHDVLQGDHVPWHENRQPKVEDLQAIHVADPPVDGADSQAQRWRLRQSPQIPRRVEAAPLVQKLLGCGQHGCDGVGVDGLAPGHNSQNGCLRWRSRPEIAVHARVLEHGGCALACH
eukprot:scaffold28690_cov63-Phaeocystis_antarctica.AAC.5